MSEQKPKLCPLLCIANAVANHSTTAPAECQQEKCAWWGQIGLDTAEIEPIPLYGCMAIKRK
jgi:hypothetical protein